MDETSSLQPLYLDFFEIDQGSLCSLGALSYTSFAPKHFLQIKNLSLTDLYCDETEVLRFGWDIIALASQSLTTFDLHWCGGKLYLDSCIAAIMVPDRIFPVRLPYMQSVPYNLGRFPALRHLKIHLQSLFRDRIPSLSFLQHLLLNSTSTSGIEALEIKITWNDHGRGDLFSSDAGWSTLDKVLSSEKFVSLEKIILNFILIDGFSERIKLEYKNFILSHANLLFPMFKTLTIRQCTLETYVEVR